VTDAAENTASFTTDSLTAEAGDATAPLHVMPQSDDVPWLRLNPRSLIVRPAKDFIRFLPVLIGLAYAGSHGGHGDYWGLGGTAIAMVTSVWRWFNTRYRVTADRVFVRRGLINQRVLSLSRETVRSVDFSAHVIYRMLGLCEVKIGTGRSDKRSGENFKLDALSVADAEALRAQLLGARTRAQPRAQRTDVVGAQATTAASAEINAGTAAAIDADAGADVEAEVEIARLHPSWIRFGPLTLTGLVILGVLVGILSQVANEAGVNYGSVSVIHSLVKRFAALSVGLKIAEGAASVLVALLVISILGYIALFWNYRLIRQGTQTLRMTRGLLSTRTTSIDTSRLRGVEISEPLSLRVAGGARCIAITTGLRVGGGAERGGSLLLPPAPRRVALSVAEQVLGVPEAVVAGPLKAHGSAARFRRYSRALAADAVVVGVTAVICAAARAPWWAWLISLVVLPLSAPLAADRYRGLGHWFDDGWLVARTGSLVRRRSILSADGIVGWRIRQSWFQRRRGLVTLTAATAAGRQHYEVHDVAMDEAIALTLAANRDLVLPFLTGVDEAPAG
jgi:putative membrane protein